MAGGLNVSAELARFAATIRWDDIPDAVRHEARRSVVNVVATALAGCADPAVAKASAVFSRFASGRECTVIGRAERMDMLHAASLNAASGNVHDYDDTHLPTILHPSAPVAPVLFALAETRQVTGRDLLAAFAVGVDVECRIANAISPWHYNRGWHITSTCGIFGAAAAAGRILGLDEQRMHWALGHASAQSSGLVETLGTMSKSIGVGNAASNGILSALLAQEGYEGPAQPLDGARGFLKVMGERADAHAVADSLGTRWELQRNTYKPYPCGVVLNPVIEACLALRAQGVQLADVEQVQLTGAPLLRERTDRALPTCGRESQVNARHAVSVALDRGKAGLDEFSDEAVRALAGRHAPLVFRDDPAMQVESATVTLKLRSGQERSHHVAAARGSLQAPLPDADLSDKLRALCAWGRSGCDPEPLLAALWSLDTAADAGQVVRLAAGRA